MKKNPKEKTLHLALPGHCRRLSSLGQKQTKTKPPPFGQKNGTRKPKLPAPLSCHHLPPISTDLPLPSGELSLLSIKLPPLPGVSNSSPNRRALTLSFHLQQIFPLKAASPPSPISSSHNPKETHHQHWNLPLSSVLLLLRSP